MPPAAIEILPNFFFIERGYLNANHFALRAAAPVLIDTAYKRDLPATLQTLRDLKLDPVAVARIVNTHTHCDHVGGNRAIQQLSGCAVALHPLGRRFMEARDARSPWWSYYQQEADFFDATETLGDGEEIAIGPHRFQALFTPGHAADGMVLYNRVDRVLISSDTLWERDVPVMTLQIEGPQALEAMQTSLEKISGLEVAHVFPGHGPPFTDFHGALARAQAKLARYTADPTRIGWDLIKKIMIYTILMKQPVPAATFFQALMQTAWYPETVDAYLSGDYRTVYNLVLDDFIARRIVRCRGENLQTVVRP
jgi:hydroxyacylglutathione hydrolase